MKHSIYKIFKNLNLLLLISLTLAFIGFVFIIEQYYSHEKIENLQNQKTTLTRIIEEEKKIK
ncbi:MAG: hypothetical protein Q9M43_12960 [Sulfurimonas sp.]|nr:hypothetical protein [Sulfurimonas sp.]